MTNQQPRPPLWELMYDAYEYSPPSRRRGIWSNEDGYAAEIRAVAYAIEERFADAANTSTDPIADVVNWLADEAQRAEAGE